jgi:serine/threonine protein kinase
VNPVRARILEGKLRGQIVGGYKILELIASGKTAAVFRASNGSVTVAIKLFDPDIVEEDGIEPQLERIELQLTLRDYPHENVVRLFDGGYDADANFVYLAMEDVGSLTLAKALPTLQLENINSIVLQLVAAARHLEDHKLAHRDIKPDNIGYDPATNKLRLLDLGVIRPFGEPGDTDDDGILKFIGTLQYSSPEFLLREMDDTVEAWRGVTIYQIGAVMHDLIVRKPIFSTQQYPYARLANAVQHTMPEIISDDVEPAVISLALSCLIKDPSVRLSLVPWERFTQVLSPSSRSFDSRDRVLARAASQAARSAATGALPEVDPVRAEIQLRDGVWQSIRSQARTFRERAPGFPPMKTWLQQDRSLIRIEIPSSQSFAIAVPITICVRLAVVSLGSSVIRLTSIACQRDGSEIDVPAELPDPVFHGPYDGRVIGQIFDEMIFAYVDSAQAGRVVVDALTPRLQFGSVA